MRKLMYYPSVSLAVLRVSSRLIRTIPTDVKYLCLEVNLEFITLSVGIRNSPTKYI